MLPIKTFYICQYCKKLGWVSDNEMEKNKLYRKKLGGCLKNAKKIIVHVNLKQIKFSLYNFNQVDYT